MKLLFRVDGAPVVGGGHVMRCLTLAHAARARGWHSVFVCRDHAGNHSGRFLEVGFATHLLPRGTLVPAGADYETWLGAPEAEDARATAAIAAAVAPDWIVVDHYGAGAQWLGAMPRGVAVLYMDDLRRVDLRADIVLDQTRTAPVAYGEGVGRVLTGPSMALLRPEFAAGAALRTELSRLLIAPGMGDAYGLAPLALEAAAGLDLAAIDVVLGGQAESLEEVRRHAGAAANVRLHVDASDVAGLIAGADLAIGAGGMSSWERCALGLGSIAVSVAENQTRICAELAAAGAAVHLPGAPRPSAEDLRAAIAGADVAALSKAAAGLCDGRGADRVLDALALEPPGRSAQKGDAG